MVFGKGLSNMSSNVKSYSTWHSMIRRCYSEVYKKSKPTYRNTKVTDEWLTLSVFNDWFIDNYVEGWQLDKDLISDFSNLYSADNCCFLPNEINCALRFDMGTNNTFPGVSIKSESGKFIAQYSRNDLQGKRKSIHLLSSNDPFKCFLAYKEAKESYIKELALKYKSSLSNLAFEKLNELQVRESYTK